MRRQDIRSNVGVVRAAEGASRRTKNHLANSGGVVGGFTADRVLVLRRDARPLAWLPIDEVEEA